MFSIHSNSKSYIFPREKANSFTMEEREAKILLIGKVPNNILHKHKTTFTSLNLPKIEWQDFQLQIS